MVKLPVKPVWLKDPTQVSLGLLSLPTNASLCTKWESNLHLSREMQALHSNRPIPCQIDREPFQSIFESPRRHQFSTWT
ncbi:hypothetical protein Hanom_Chr11g01022351 [Helianthus anomalus]